MIQLYYCQEKLDAGHLGFKGLNRRRWGVSQAAVDRQQPAFDETLGTTHYQIR